MSLTLSRPLPAELTNFESPVVRRTRWACLVIMFLCFPLVAWLGAKESSFAELEQALVAKHAAAKGMSRKKVTPGKLVSRNRAGKTTAPQKVVRPKTMSKKVARKKA